MDFNKFFQSKVFTVTIWVIAGFIVVLLVFSAGIKVGTLKARYSYKWAETYHRNFAGPRGGFWGDWRRFPAGDFISGHGSFGEVIEMKDNGFVIKGRDNVEKVIVITQDTTITKDRETISSKGESVGGGNNGLKVGDRVVVIGSPNEEGQIVAKFIRVFKEDGPGFLHQPRRPITLF